MRYAILSDIHGNIEALNAVLADINWRSVDCLVCLGDIVGYYPDPELCVQIIKTYVPLCIGGNHDYAASNRISTSNFTHYAMIAMEWTKTQLSDNSKSFLSTLPLFLEHNSLMFLHSSPANPERFSYVLPSNKRALQNAFMNMVRKINFIGHAHWPFMVMRDEEGHLFFSDDVMDINEHRYYLINVGSVGQPRNYDPRSTYALFDTEARQIALVRVPYDYTTTQKKVIAHKLPLYLAERLAKGH